jgi:Zn-dependent protease
MAGDLNLTYLIIVFVSILIAMTVHEATHAYVGYALGDTTAEEEGRLSLNPLRHIDPFTTILLPVITLVLFQAPILAAKPVPFNPYRVRYGEWGAALIAGAGPLSNFLMAAIAAGIFRLSDPSSFAAAVLYVFVTLNVALGVFNLVPIPPLDGSRVLFAFAPEPLQDFMRQIEPYGLFIIFGLVLLGGFGGWLVSLNQAVLQFLL